MSSTVLAPAATEAPTRQDVPKPMGSVGIVGGGFMGAGIAEAASLAGIPVVLHELPEFLEAARGRLEGSLERAVKRGKRDAEDRDAALARTTLTSDLQDMAGVELVIEAVPESVALKTSIMQAARRHRRRRRRDRVEHVVHPDRPTGECGGPPGPGGGPALLLPGARDATGGDRARPRHQ